MTKTLEQEQQNEVLARLHKKEKKKTMQQKIDKFHGQLIWTRSALVNFQYQNT